MQVSVANLSFACDDVMSYDLYNCKHFAKLLLNVTKVIEIP